MKRVIIYLLISCALILTKNSVAQNDPKEGDYVKNEKMDKFNGTWEWRSVDNDSVFVVVLKKVRINFNKLRGFRSRGSDEDKLFGWHKFSISGKIIESSLDSVGGSVFSTTIKCNDVDDLKTGTLFFFDRTKSKGGEALLEFLPGEKDLAR